MEYAFVGTTGMRVSRLAFGTMTFGGDADLEASRDLFHRCLDAGIDHFDTADVYNAGRSEEILGQLMQGHRERLVIATKAYFPSGEGPNDRGSSRRHLVDALEGSLRRLRTDRVELFYLHRFDDATDLEQTLRAVEQLVAQGKVLHPAVSNFAAWQVVEALGVQALRGWAPLVALQPMYNLTKRQAEVELLPMAQAKRLGVFPYSPLGGGLLSGKYGAGSRPGAGRVVDWEIYRMRYGTDQAMAVAEGFRALADELGVHPAALAVAWVARHPAVTAPLLGARSVAQLEPALGALDIDLTPELRARISALTPEPPPATDRNEEGLVQGLGTR
jgi:aryl-alcohol dehydrogenase-like predicted oxidoreductase